MTPLSILALIGTGLGLLILFLVALDAAGAAFSASMRALSRLSTRNTPRPGSKE